MMTILLLFFPLIAALAVLLGGSKLAAQLALGLAVVELAITGYAVSVFQASGPEAFYIFHSWIESPKVSFHLGLDGLSLVMVLLTNFLTPIIILSAFNRNTPHAAGYFSLILLMQFALVGVFMAMDGLLYYIFWELALIPIYFIALRWGGTNRVAITLKFFIYTLAGSLLMLFGFIMLYWYNPDQSFDIRELYRIYISDGNQSWLFWMFFLAFAIKIPIVPFHTWQADTYRESPTQGTMLLSGIMLKMGTYSLIRWLLPILPMGVAKWGPLAITLCVVGIVYASIIAIKQRNLKNLLAYSSLAHVGLIAAGIFALNIQGLQGSVVQMVAHGVNVVGLFFCADIIFNRTNTNETNELGGIRNLAPQFTTMFMVIVLGSVALPLTNGFIGEFLLLYGVYEYNTWLSVFAGLTIILGAVYMLRMFKKVMLGETGVRVPVFPDLYWNEKLALGILVVVIVAMGVYPKPILDMAEPVLQTILNKTVI
ncbi:MAG: NADH-quinone oxidoreductase subunit M [Saprospiraceae bacterium]|nr:NADH-quinone oxidoreductase subunit M [Candidatus Opimibacter skivensis]MBL0009196.1 NADH-quinone oxidoreductase subunit M [Candidatus Opimibacter skivensis]